MYFNLEQRSACLGVLMKISINYFKAIFLYWCLKYFLWNCTQMNVTWLYWYVDIGSGNGLMPPGSTSLLEPMLTSFCRQISGMLDKCSLVHHDVIKWKHFPYYWPFVRGIHRSPGEFPLQRPVMRSFAVFFDVRLKKRLSKQSRYWWLETT